MRSRSHFPLFALANGLGACCVILVLLGVQAAADQNAATDDVPMLIPYRGILERDGRPVTLTGSDAPLMTFELVDGAAADAPTVFSQTMQVNVYQGRFMALLGGDGACDGCLQRAIADGDELYVQVSVNGTTLSDHQRLLLSPYAVWATHAADFTSIGGDSVVGRDVSVGRRVDLAGASASYVENVNAVSGDEVVVGGAYTTSGGVAVARSAFVGSTGSDTTLINGDLHGESSLFVSSSISLSGPLTVARTATIPTIDSGASVTNLNAAHGPVTFHGDVAIPGGPLQPLDNVVSFTSSPGDSTDTASIAYVDERPNGVDTALQIKVGDNANDIITFHTNGSEALRLADGAVSTTRGIYVGGTFRHSTVLRSCTADSNCLTGESCLDGNETTNYCGRETPGNRTAGGWRDIATCANNTYMCGMEIRSEPAEGGDDDIGVGDTRIRCCRF